MLLDVNRREDVVLDESLGDDDGVLEVVALPRHERHEQVPAEGKLACIGGRAVGEHIANLDLVALPDQCLVIHACALVGPSELVEGEGVLLIGLGFLHDDLVTVDLDDLAGNGRNDHVSGVLGGTAFHTCADERGVGGQKRHSLTLHVRAHQSPVGVVMLEEGDQRR